MFDNRQLKEAYKTLKIGSDWIRLDQIGSDDLRMALRMTTLGFLREPPIHLNFVFLNIAIQLHNSYQ